MIPRERPLEGSSGYRSPEVAVVSRAYRDNSRYYFGFLRESSEYNNACTGRVVVRIIPAGQGNNQVTPAGEFAGVCFDTMVDALALLACASTHMILP